ncbi:Stage II sporulation protein Q [compost metagenome]
MQWPVVDYDKLEVALQYYDANGTNEEKQAAMVLQTNTSTYTAHVGLDLAKPDNTTFDVLAALSGKVTHVEKGHPTNGDTVEISHGDGLVTIYQSLSDVTVNEGDEVKQGTAIAKAGRNDLEKDEGIHLHFEARQNGKVLNPNDLIKK